MRWSILIGDQTNRYALHSYHNRSMDTFSDSKKMWYYFLADLKIDFLRLSLTALILDF